MTHLKSCTWLSLGTSKFIFEILQCVAEIVIAFSISSYCPTLEEAFILVVDTARHDADNCSENP
jgi:hypothetical protein